MCPSNHNHPSLSPTKDDGQRDLSVLCMCQENGIVMMLGLDRQMSSRKPLGNQGISL